MTFFSAVFIGKLTQAKNSVKFERERELNKKAPHREPS